jgi:hypothetical protein
MNITDILTLSDGNEYIIASKAEHEYKIYLLLVDINNNKNVKFCYLDNDEVVVVKKENLSEVLVLKLLRSMSKLADMIKDEENNE